MMFLSYKMLFRIIGSDNSFISNGLKQPAGNPFIPS